MSDQHKEILLRASIKTLTVFLVVTALNYFVDESSFLNLFEKFGLAGWILLFVVFCISNFIQSKFKKD